MSQRKRTLTSRWHLVGVLVLCILPLLVTANSTQASPGRIGVPRIMDTPTTSPAGTPPTATNAPAYTPTYAVSSTATATPTLVGWDCATPTVNPTFIEVPGSGGYYAIDVTAEPNCAWHAAASVSWLQYYCHGSGTGPGLIICSFGTNPMPYGRQGGIDACIDLIGYYHCAATHITWDPPWWPTPTGTATLISTNTPANAPTGTPTNVPTFTPTPSCCNNVSGTTRSWCGTYHSVSFSFELTNDCNEAMVGNGAVDLEVSRSPSGPWRYWETVRDLTNYSIPPGTSSSGGNVGAGPGGDYWRSHLHLVGVCWEVDAVGPTVVWCWNTPTRVPFSTDTPTNGTQTPEHEATCTKTFTRTPTETPTITLTPTGTPPTRTPTFTPTTTFAPPTPSATLTSTATPSPGPCVIPIIEGFESGTLGLFASSGNPGWSAVTTLSHSGAYSAFAPDVPFVSDQRLTISNAIAVPLNVMAASLIFWQQYEFDGDTFTGYDGGVLEVSTDSGATWSNPSFDFGEYTGTIVSCPSLNPLAGRNAWVGSSGGWTRVEADLTRYRGLSVLFRFRLGTDQAAKATGWWVDDVVASFTQSYCWTPTATPIVTVATRTSTPTSSATPTLTPTRTPTATGTPPTATRTATLCPMNFSDVHPSDYFYPGVAYLYCHGAVTGYADYTFRPYNLTTRGQLTKIVVLAQGWTIYIPTAPSFSDVPSTNPFYQYIETAHNHNIISGYACGPTCLEFRPGDNVTRGQLSKIIVLAKGWQLYTPPVPTFQDVAANDTFYAFIETAYNHNIISGYSCGPTCLEFRQGNNAIRGQISKIIFLAVTQP
jgi:hypothetical protein